MKKMIVTVFVAFAFAIVAGVGNSSLAPAKEKLNEQIYGATISVSDCL